VNEQLKILEDALQECMIADRFDFRNRIKRLRSTAGKGAGKETLNTREVEKLLVQIRKSVGRVERRKSTTPPVAYPEELPITSRVEEIKKTIADHQVVILAGETGSGKTTQLPKICLELGRGIKGMIGHTQPRRVAARTVGNRIADELGVDFGNEVGYHVRFNDQFTGDTLVKVMTDGILLAETSQDKFLEKYDTLIIDEAHERSLNIDFILGYLKRLLPRRKDLKLVITSATIDVERFSQHFNDAPIIEVSGRTYPVELHYRPVELLSELSDGDSEELVEQAIVDVIQEIQQLDRQSSRKIPGDVLVFLSGEREIRELSHTLRKADFPHTEILPLYSRLSVSEQNRVFQKHRGRRIILATNVAETSLTVPGIRYVIDPGFARISRYSYRSKVQRLPIEAISQASADQRKGRCGRISKGVCFRLYSEEDFRSRPEFTDPEILRTNLASVILQMLTLRLGEIEDFPFVEKPDRKQINDGFQLLHELQAVNGQRRVTEVGRSLAKIPIDLQLARMLVSANKFGSLKELLIITSALAVQDPRDRPYDHRQAADQAHRSYWDKESDFITLLRLWNDFEERRQALTQNQLRKYCKQNFLSYLRMREWRDIHRQLHLMCRELGFRENEAAADYAEIHKALLSGLLGNIGTRNQDNDYLGTRNRHFYIFPGSSQFKNKPRWLVCAELVETTRLFGRTVARIESDWIEKLASHLVSRNWSEPHWEKKRGQVVAYEQVTLYGLVIVNRRKVNYGPLNPTESRDIFIRSALAERQMNTRAQFFQHNQELVEEIEQMEAKTRRRDILVDEETICAFYDELIPADVFDQGSFDKWRKVAEKKQPDLLCMNQDFLLNNDADLSDRAFPDQLGVGESELQLDYHFDPQHDRDGVSVSVPLGLLQQMPESQLDWLVPGFLHDKCLALVKSLPKSIRKNFVPAPDYVSEAVRHMTYDGRALVEVLAEQLHRRTGVNIPEDAWSQSAVADHLKMNIRIVDENGLELGAGRDLQSLKSQFKKQSADSFRTAELVSLEKTGLSAWDFDELPECIEIEQGAVTVRAFPALVDHGAAVAIKLIENEDRARFLSRRGLLRLITFELSDQIKYIRKNLTGVNRFAIFYVKIGSRDELIDDMVNAIFRYVFIENKKLPTSRAEFDSRLEDRQDLFNVANEVSDLVGKCLAEFNSLKKRLSDLQGNTNYRAVIEDVSFQLDQLIHAGFLNSVPFQWLKQYPRYLKAVNARLERLQGGLGRDLQAIEELSELWHKYGDHIARSELETDNPELELYRWMIEEYRVSLFAQTLGTYIPVSAKRLEKQWIKATK
jgi:ATP-dependent helicase HrpA